MGERLPTFAEEYRANLKLVVCRAAPHPAWIPILLLLQSPDRGEPWLSGERTPRARRNPAVAGTSLVQDNGRRKKLKRCRTAREPLSSLPPAEARDLIYPWTPRPGWRMVSVRRRVVGVATRGGATPLYLHLICSLQVPAWALKP